MDGLDFSIDEQEKVEKSAGAEIADALSGKEKKETEEPDQTIEEDIQVIEASEEETGDAVIMFEDDNFIFTSEGIVDKKSLTESKDNSSDAEPDKKDEKILGKFDNHDELIKSYKELEKKLGSNSEAVNKLKELNPVLPMLEAMLGDETFLEMAESYFTDPKAQSEAMKKQLGIDDDFTFDLNQALSDPKSEDAKILNKLMQAKQPKKTQKQPEQSQQISDTEKKALMEKYGLDDEGYKEMMDKAAAHTITHDDIYFLMNRDKIIADAKKEAQSNVKKQMNTAQRLKKPVTAGGGSAQEPSPEDSFMNALSAGKGLFE